MSPAGTPTSRKRGRPRRVDIEASSSLPSNSPLASIKRRKLITYGSSPTSNGTWSRSNKGLDKFKDLVGIDQADAQKKKGPRSTEEASNKLKPRTSVDGTQNGHLNGGRRLSARKAAEETHKEEHAASQSCTRVNEKRNLDPIAVEVEHQGNGTYSRGRRKTLILQADSSTLFVDAKKEEQAEPVPNPFKRGRKSDVERKGDEKVIAHVGKPAETPRRRGRPRKQPSGSADVLNGTSPWKKGQGTRGSQFVKGKTKQDGIDLGFKDIPFRVSSSDGTPTKLVEAPGSAASQLGSRERSESIDPLSISDPRKVIKPTRLARSGDKSSSKIYSVDKDIACAICKDVDSEPPNEILLCDGCDLAVHQLCYDIPEIPEDDWFCLECLSKDDMLDVDIDEKLTPESQALPDIENAEQHLRRFQRLVLDQLTGHDRVALRGHDDEMQKVHQLVEQTVVAGEGNSMLVIGSRACGKTNLVESVISSLSEGHKDSFHVVRLNGFIHTDDKLASREIWRQLGREMEVQDESNGRVPSYADTLASLLALLSDPSELSEDQADQTAKSVIFILDEFDLFATHPRQTLLYNLFDIAQAKKAPIAVLGLTTRIDVTESLEKRVKSRFSHRYVHLSLAKSLPAFWDICKQYLLVDTKRLKRVDYGFIPGQDKFLSFWNSMVDNLYTEDAQFKHHIQSHFYRSKSIPEFLTTCVLPISNLSNSKFPMTGKSCATTFITLSPPDSKLDIIQSLSELEVALLIAAARLDIIFDTDTCNFAMAYEEYSALTSRHKIQTSSIGGATFGTSAKVWGREVALEAWERLAEYGLLVPTGHGGGAAQAGGLAGRMWKVDVALEEIGGNVGGMSGIMARWCKEI